MNKPRKIVTFEEYKIKASILLKSLKSNDIETVIKSIKRLQRLSEFAELSPAEIIPNDIKRKHALAVIAIENGFQSWNDLKSQINFVIGGFLNLWFANYAEAKSHLQTKGGYLFPYKKQFFICEATYIKQLSLDPKDPDWKLIAFDWAKPENKEAWRRLYKKWMQVQGGHNE